MRNYDQEKEMSSKAEYLLLKSISRHPNIVEAKDFITTERWTYHLMAYAEGLELQEYASNIW